jgi:hypothetical protein
MEELLAVLADVGSFWSATKRAGVMGGKAICGEAAWGAPRIGAARESV